MSSIIEKTRDVHQVKAPQAIVHIKHTITLRQYKIWVILLQRFRECYEGGDEPDEDGFFRLAKSELVELFGYEPTKDELRADFEKLRREPIIANYLEKDGTPTMHGMGFVSEWKVSTKAIRFKIPSLLQKVMQGLDQPRAIFQLINWQIFDHFTGKYEAIIYKLCRDYVGINKTPYFTLQEFREYIGLKEGEYKEFMDLNKWIIKNSVNKINSSELSDISISPDFKKSGRKVLGLLFKVERRRQQSIPFEEFQESPAFRFAKVTIEPSTQTEYLAIRGPDDVALCIERANEYGEKISAQGKPVNYGAIYRTSIVEGWHIQHLENKTKKIADQAKKKASAQNEADTLKEEEEKRKAEKAESARRWAEFLTLPEAEQDATIRQALEGKTIALSHYMKSGKEIPIVKSSTLAYLRAQR